MFEKAIDPLTIVGTGFGGGADAEMSLVVNGVAPAVPEHYPVPAGKKLVITDMLVGARQTATEFIVQQSPDGGGHWYNVALERSGGQDSNIVAYEAPRAIKGGDQCLVRILQNGGFGANVCTLLGWLEDVGVNQGILSKEYGLPSCTGRVHTAGAGEQTLPLGYELQDPAAALVVPDGFAIEITDWVVCASLGSTFRIEQSIDAGASWFTRAQAYVTGGGPSKHFRFRTPIRIVGGPDVQFRHRVQTPNGAGDVDATLGIIQQPGGVGVVAAS